MRFPLPCFLMASLLGCATVHPEDTEAWVGIVLGEGGGDEGRDDTPRPPDRSGSSRRSSSRLTISYTTPRGTIHAERRRTVFDGPAFPSRLFGIETRSRFSCGSRMALAAKGGIHRVLWEC